MLAEKPSIVLPLLALSRTADNVNKRDYTALVCVPTSTRFTMRNQKFLALIPILLLCAAPMLSHAGIGVGVSVNIAPPVIPVYAQPALPAPGYLWSPGYWAWDGNDYYWVPGTWVEPPSSGMLWTPGYWNYQNGSYVWSEGYWGPNIGYYGGVNYGFGYTGVGYQGGYWHGGAFFYNRAVANFGGVHVANVYSTPVRVREVSRVSYNGGPGGLRVQPSPEERHAMMEHHVAPTPLQFQHQQHAAAMPAMHVSQNRGRPQILTTARAGDFSHPGPAGLHNHQGAPAPGGAMRGPDRPPNGGAMMMRGGPPSQGGESHDQPRDQVQRHEHGQPHEQGQPREQSQPHEQGQPREQGQPHEQGRSREPPQGQQHEQAPRPQAAPHPQEHAEPKHEEEHHDH
jgi:hypothetical protein